MREIRLPTPRNQLLELWIAAGIILANWALLLAGLARQSMWIDEWFTVQDISPAWSDFLPQLIQTERRPPLYWALLKMWLAVSGHSELAMRFISIAATAVIIAITFRLARVLVGPKATLIAAAMIGFSPFLLLYGRMIRSYALFTLLTAAATWALIRLETKLTLGRWLVYAALASALLYTDYGAWAVLSAHGLWLLKPHRLLRPHRSSVRPDRSYQTLAEHKSARWRPVRSKLIPLSALLLAGIAFTPWIGVMLTQAGHPGQEADLARSGLGLALKLIFPFAALGAGETIYPWHPLAALSILTCGLLALNGFVNLVRRCAAGAWLLAIWFSLALLFTATILSTVAADITFLNMASRAPHLVIAYSLLIAAGVAAIKNNRWRIATVSLMGLTSALALFNYYTGRDFYNPIYAVPMRPIVEQVKQQSTANDLIIADSDTLFGYYYLAQPGAAVYQDSDFATNRAAIESQPPARVWLITFGRDRTAGLGQVDELREWLQTNYVESSQAGYGAVGPSYRWVKEQLLHRPAYEYKLMIGVYEKMTKDEGRKTNHKPLVLGSSSLVFRPWSFAL